MSIKQELIDIIVNFVTNKKADVLKQAFIKSPTIVKTIQDMWVAYDKVQSDVDDFCKKHPKSCKEANDDVQNLKNYIKRFDR